MPEVLETLEGATGATFELVPLTNTLLGSSVTCSGLLPGRAFIAALEGRGGLDLALIPAEALNDNGRFLDDLTLAQLEAASPVEVRPSYDFADALTAGEVA
jgi:NifB/MoaA-like Fe-S oxidoreductase